MSAEDIELIKDWLRMWAAERKLVADFEGECGFSRACVGIRGDTGWIDLAPSVKYGDDRNPIWAPDVNLVPHARPYVQDTKTDLAPDAYHKHDCLAVLVHDHDYDKAVDQLYKWVRNIDMHGLVVKTSTREGRNDPINLILHGATVTYLDNP